MSPYFALYTVENNKNKKSVKFQGDMLNFCDFIQVFVFTRNHHLNMVTANYMTDCGQLTVPACDGWMTCDIRS